MDGHHLILGTTVDFITGEKLRDTHDERYRQKIAKILVEKCGYLKTDIQVRVPLGVTAGEKTERFILDLAVLLAGNYHMIIQYGPGSLVTRHRPGLALGRILAPYQIPVVVVTNGEDADILDGKSGQVMATGLDAFPARSRLTDIGEHTGFPAVSEKQQALESRIVFAFEIDGRCPCEDTHSDCRLTQTPDGIAP